MANETQIYVGKLGAQALYKRLKQLIGRITTYKKVPADEHGYPDESNPDSRTIYLVKDESVVGEDKFFEWIWTSPNIWECIGTTSEPCNSWKQWSEENGSSGEGDSVYIGKNNELGRDESYSLGKDNTVEVTDDTVYTGTDVVEIGTSNTAMNAANAYQLGRENSVIDNNLAAKLDYPHSMALNLGRNNKIVGEGVNVGKDNDATTFGINIGQNNFSSNASCSVGQHVMSDHSSLSMGNAEPTLATATVGNVPSMLVNGKYEHVQQFRLKDRYHLFEHATIYQDPDDNKYKWAAIQSTRLKIYPNYELDQYLVSWGSGAQAGTITGYYDEEGVFHESSDTSHNIHTYGIVTNVGNPSGSDRVQLNPPFYASFVNTEETRNDITYVMRAEITLPAYGTILTRSEYETLIAGAVTPVMQGSISDLFINLDDLTADGYKIPGLTGTNALPFPLSYEVYGYKDNDVLIPYNELNKDETHDFDWYEVDWSDIQGNTLPVKQVNPRAELIVADDRSATFGMGSLYAGGRSITISTNTNSTYQIRYQGTYETNVLHTYSGTRYTIDQETGNYTTTSATISCFTSNYGQFNSKVAPYCASADGGSIVISNNYGTAYGSSIAIGNYANADGFSYVFGESSTASGKSFAFGKAAFGYEYSMALGFDNAYATKRSIALGISGVNAQNDSIAIGFNGLYSSDHSLAFGYGGYADDKAICIGFSNNATSQSVAIGDNNSTSGGAVAIGITNTGLGGATMSGTCIGLGISNSVGGNSFAAGNGCLGNNAGIVLGIGSSARDGSISLGIGCSGYRGAILLGIGNYTSSSDDAYGNAVVMGFGNQVYNVREALYKNGWSSRVTTCGIAIGSYIKGYGHNFISFGSKNILGDPAHWSEDGHNTVTDNDGFMTAIGFECVAFRNYDFAYGYQSVANGGENIAFQHSTAIGYRNIAMIDSNVQNSIASVALCESNLLATATDIKYNGMVHNLLFHSKVECVRNFNSSILFNTTLNVTNSGNGFSRNIFNIGTMNHVVNLDLQGYGSVANNILIGAKNGEYLGSWSDYGSINLSTNTSISRNVLLNNAYQSLNTIYACVDNMIRSSEINIVSGAVKTFADNFIDCSGLEMTYGSSSTNIIGNVLHGRSKLYAPNTSVAGFHYNFLLNSILGNNTGTPTSAKYGQENTRNFLFNAAAYNADSCFCMSLGGGISSRGDGIQQGVFNRSDYNNFTQSTPGSVLADCIGVFNFGDGICISSVNSVNFGHNKMSDSSGNFIAGLNNIAIGRYGSPYSLTNVRIFGNDNNVNNLSSGSSVAHLTVIGDTNTINTDVNCGENTIIGSLNYFVEPYNIQILTPDQVDTPLSQRKYYKVSEPCIMPDGDNTYRNQITYVNTTYYYVRYGNRVAYMSSNDPWYADTTPVQTSPSNFQYMFNAGTLPVGVYYQMTSSSNINAIPSGILLLPGVVYDLGPYNSTYNTRYGIDDDIQIALNRGIVGNSPVSHNSRNTIIGSVNGICSRVVDYTIIGSQNTIKCTSGFTASDNYAISNGFVQGNDNDIRNGSNIVTMGNGNVSTGHNSVAIGCQLISNQWQTVLGKYNAAIAGPNRLASETPQDPTKALLIVGNGYTSKDDYNWQDETYITRSNAMVVYADGTVNAHDFVSDNELTLDGQNGISVTEDLVNSKVVISLDSATADIINFLKSKPAQGTYGIQSTDGVLSWVAIGLV